MSARPDLCGGQPARAVPTAINSNGGKQWYALERATGIVPVSPGGARRSALSAWPAYLNRTTACPTYGIRHSALMSEMGAISLKAPKSLALARALA